MESKLLFGKEYLELLMSKVLESGVVTVLRPMRNPLHWKGRSGEPGRRNLRLLGGLILSLLAISCTPQPLAAHAVLVESTPAPKSTSSGPNIAVRLRFNVRIDSERSILTLVRKDGTSAKLQTDKQPAANMLVATAVGLLAGEYRIRWQVLASDGHVTSGEIPFSVAGR